jgi:hypothetical protein
MQKHRAASGGVEYSATTQLDSTVSSSVSISSSRLCLLASLQIGGLLVQGATFDGTRLGPLTQVRGMCAMLR